MNNSFHFQRALIFTSIGIFILASFAVNVIGLFLPIPGYDIKYWFLLYFYFFLALLLMSDKEYLKIFRIDRLSVLVVIFMGTILHRRFGIDGENVYLVLLWIGSILILLGLLRSWKYLTWPTRRGASAILITTALFFIGLLLNDYLHTNFLTRTSKGVIFFRSLIFNLSFVAPLEEFLFRGFLWGTLVNIGWSERKAGLTQGLLFWLIHFRSDSVFVFLVIVPLLTLFLSYFACKSRSLFMSVMTHAFANAFSEIM